MTTIYGSQWEDSLRGLAYPFASPYLPTSGDLTVPVNFIMDAAIFMRSSESTAVLESITVGPLRALTITFADSAKTPVGTAVVPTNGGLVAITQGGVNVGFISVDPDAAAIVQGWFPRTYTFGAPLVPNVVVVSDPAWLRGLVCPDGTVLSGDAYIVGAPGIVLTPTPTGVSVAAVGDPYGGRSGPSRTLLSLGGALPDANGNISIIPVSPGGTSFRVNVIPLGSGTIRFEAQGV